MKSRKIWGPRPEYREFLDQTIKLYPTLLGHVDADRIYLCGFIARRSRHLAKISGNKNPWALMLPDFDYAIQFHDPVFSRSSEEMKVYVMLHELWHILQFGFDKNHPDYRRLKTHDVEEFNSLIAVYGLNLEKVHRVLRGEKSFFKHLNQMGTDGIRRFPRIAKIQ